MDRNEFERRIKELEDQLAEIQILRQEVTNRMLDRKRCRLSPELQAVMNRLTPTKGK